MSDWQQRAIWEEAVEAIGAVETLKQGLALFVELEMPVRDWSERTRQEYTNDLEDLVEFLENRGVSRLEQVSLKHLKQYKAELLDQRGYAKSTCRRKVSAIKTFFGYLHEKGLLAEDISQKLTPPARGRREPRFLTRQEYQALREACADHPRDRAIIEVLLQTGMRLGELTGLRVPDVVLPGLISPDPDDVGWVTVKRGGGETSQIPLNYKACRALKDWMSKRPEVDHEALFVARDGSPMSKRTVQYTVKKYLQEAGIKNASVRTLRHTMATYHVVQGTDLETIQHTLGLENKDAAEIYLALARKAQRKALQQHAL